jgi:hypothetical protein
VLLRRDPPASDNLTDAIIMQIGYYAAMQQHPHLVSKVFASSSAEFVASLLSIRS